MNPEAATNKKLIIVRTAIDLFASQGYNGTTTLQIGVSAGVTEPAIFYYFKTKGELFADIIESIFKKYFARLDALKKKTRTEFAKIEQLIGMHLDFVNEMPAESYLVISACPAKMKDSAHICTRNIDEQRG